MNPVFFSYVSDIDTSLVKPTAIVVAGRSNWYRPGFQQVISRGGELYAYLNVIERPDAISTTEPVLLDVYMGGVNNVPLWGNNRIQWEGTKMTDIRPGSAWTKYILAWCEKLMREGKVSGLFLDAIGGRLWGKLSQWEAWPVEERLQWTNSAVQFVKELDAIRRRVNDRFKIVNNNTWFGGEQGEQYVDGVCLEHSPPNEYHTNYSRRAFGSLGQRRVIVQAKNALEGAAWAKEQGPTHITVVDTSLGQTYLKATPPFGGYTDLRLDESNAYIARLKTLLADQIEDEANLKVELGALRFQVADRDNILKAYRERFDAINTLSKV